MEAQKKLNHAFNENRNLKMTLGDTQTNIALLKAVQHTSIKLLNPCLSYSFKSQYIACLSVAISEANLKD